jgi:hypothetical protein
MLNKEKSIKWLQERTKGYRSTMSNTGELVEDFDEVGKLGSGFTSIDELEEVDIGDGITLWATYVNASLTSEQKSEVWGLLKEYVDCFVWNYNQMPALAEHRLPIKPGFRPYKQLTWNFNSVIIDKVKEEVDRLLQAKFIWPL